jgi:hypothetical protein
MLPASDANASVLIRIASWRAKEKKMDYRTLYNFITIIEDGFAMPQNSNVKIKNNCLIITSDKYVIKITKNNMNIAKKEG